MGRYNLWVIGPNDWDTVERILSYYHETHGPLQWTPRGWENPHDMLDDYWTVPFPCMTDSGAFNEGEWVDDAQFGATWMTFGADVRVINWKMWEREVEQPPKAYALFCGSRDGNLKTRQGGWGEEQATMIAREMQRVLNDYPWLWNIHCHD